MPPRRLAVAQIAGRPLQVATASSRRSLTTTWPNSPWAASSCAARCRRASTCVGVVGAAADQARRAAPPRRRRDEDLHRLGHRLAHLARALDLDLQHDRDARRAMRSLELGAQRAVAAAGVLGVLDELAGRDAPLELLVGEEVVVDAVLLARPRARAWWPRPTARARARARAACGSACPCRPRRGR